MVQACGKCGGLYGTEQWEKFAGTPCRCPQPYPPLTTAGAQEWQVGIPLPEPERIWIDGLVIETSRKRGHGRYYFNNSHDDQDLNEYVRADLAAPDAAQDDDLVSRSAVLDAIGHHLAYYKDHYMHCLTRCVPELIEKLPTANPDAVRQAEETKLLELIERFDREVKSLNEGLVRGPVTDYHKLRLKKLAEFLAAALRAEGEKGEENATSK